MTGNVEICYIDGSRNGKLAGAGVYRWSGGNGTIISVGRYTNIFQSEMTGIAGANYLVIQQSSSHTTIKPRRGIKTRPGIPRYDILLRPGFCSGSLATLPSGAAR